MADALLADLSRQLKERFEADRQVLSFAEYLELFREHPRQQGRNVAQYLADVFDHYGTETVVRPYGRLRRFKLFDLEFDGGRDRLIGHEAVQGRIYSALRNFIRQRRVNKLLLLHGPNGSAKSTIISCMARAMEHYSRTPEGALYRFNWVFPSEKLSRKKGIGFGDSADGQASSLSTYAYLSEDDVQARLISDVSDPPIFLIPKDKRRALLDELVPPSDERFVWSEYLREGDLSHTSRQIFDALLEAYEGDFSKVLRHVQVERLYVSQRYRRAAVTIEPQLRVDAGVRQVTMDRSLSSLPPSLQNLTLYEPFGDLVDANRGLLEFNDLLKRPLDAFKYILSTCEKSTAALDSCILHLDSFFVGSANEKHLAAFKEMPDFQAFQGRLELIRVPYLRDAELERQIYEEQIETALGDAPLAPHTMRVAAMWSVLTRLHKPDPDRYAEPIRKVVGALTPEEKLRLYEEGEPPDKVATEIANELRTAIRDLWTESDARPVYEGLFGASPREIKTLLLNAAQSPDHDCVSPLTFIDQLSALVQDRSSYEFLQIEPQGGYHDARAFVAVVRGRYLELVNQEVRDATGLVDEESYLTLFERYVTQVKHAVRREKVANPITGKVEDPDEGLMAEVERKLEIVGKPKEFREQFFSRIGAWSHENPGERVDLRTLFAKHIAQLRESYFAVQHRTLRSILEAVLRLSDDSAEALPDDLRQRAIHTLATLEERYGYPEVCAREAVSFLLKERYADE